MVYIGDGLELVSWIHFKNAFLEGTVRLVEGKSPRNGAFQRELWLHIKFDCRTNYEAKICHTHTDNKDKKG